MMDSTDVTSTMGNVEIHNDYSKKQRFYLGVKLLLIGLLLPAVDVGTDFYAIYQYWTLNQWILKYMAKGSIFIIFSHNLVSAWYGWRNWSEPRARNFGTILCLIFGFGNIRLTIEILASLLFRQDVDAR